VLNLRGEVLNNAGEFMTAEKFPYSWFKA
jgi:hypothetical protein